jgi:hypothetical protein
MWFQAANVTFQQNFIILIVVRIRPLSVGLRRRKSEEKHSVSCLHRLPSNLTWVSSFLPKYVSMYV